ncbi:FabD/lysophospholipase-like protein [Annulohypoxylon maeteangense]|uniref:FabD/lysophospholipase-like protein n=1 Tax=Annulohypoxylon maeteangense TaxID=1927788 RepID=UPI00200852C0|nr:FabD/lysophospholipase-like protein [Annulohypoxylon maeteangense]KAI0886923.1 FabD/lysophospholipase-like protein [Annulohypoxylon maeteangense]
MAGRLPLSQPCQTCGTNAEKTFTCIQCNNLAFCDSCWAKWVLHTPGAVGWNGKPHEKADPLVLHRLRQILEPTRTEAEHESELLEDRDTTWFGFGRDASGHPLFRDFGRFAAIMSETATDETAERYPQLATFIGETGVGKSTLIKLLIDRHDLTDPEGVSYYAPVTSSSHDRISTTGDVHLYADPSTLYTTHPLLLVDCEGLSGGEAIPKQLRHGQQGSSRTDSDDVGTSRPCLTRKIAWADTPYTQKREYAVSQLYPRILYTFSDVVVFVLRNPRSFESVVLDKLIRWGAASIDKSLNQPVLPHAIIVFNATDINVDEKEWDVNKATQMLMTDIQDAILREPALQEHVHTWRRRGKTIKSAKELLECYYASISVVRIPYKGSYMLMNEQVGKLCDLLKDHCKASYLRKRQVRMLANTEKLQFYLQAAYDHFTKDLNTPFDFVKETLRHSPISRNFEGNILNLALAIKEKTCDPFLAGDAEQIFRAMGPMIASCVMLDAVRQNLPGSAARLLDDRYAKPCAGALQTFADLYCPCSFTNASYDGDLGQCCNVRSGHNPKGHQNKHGKIIGNGDYESNFNASDFRPTWEELLKASLAQVQSSCYKLGQDFVDRNELQIAAILHQERLNELYSNILGSANKFISYSACLCCLRELPECALPCGHVLCFPCIQIYGARTSRTTIEISHCPLHVRDVIASPPWIITTKPRYAGSRVLCLDGGGIRGIIQLQVLVEIEKVLGPDLPIQLFFDLIVGTNAGGIIAIALGVKKWTVNATMEKFKDLCNEGFTPREMTSVPIFGALSSLYHGSLYKTKPFAKALKRYLSDQPFFGNAIHRSRVVSSTKVAVTASTGIERQPVVFANYNRLDLPRKRLPYKFVRSDSPSREMLIWEAARATSATPPFFKPYLKAETNQEYANNDLRYSCPVTVAHYEAKSIWSDIADSPPDIMLSIGTGRNVGDRHIDDSNAYRSSRSLTNETVTTTGLGTSAVIRQGRGGAGNYSKRQTTPTSPIADGASLWKAATASGYVVRDPKTPMLVSFNNPVPSQTEKLNDQRQCEITWNRFMSSSTMKDEETRRRYMRICPELLVRLPKFDEVQRMDSVERETAEVLRQNRQDIVEAAHRLVASTFFFEKDPSGVKQTASGYTCTGSVFCRFRSSSSELKALGWFLISRLDGDFEPYFLLEVQEEAGAPWAPRQIILTNSVLEDMHLQGNFDLNPVRINSATEHAQITISLCLQTRPYPSGVTILPISGFPRKLMSEDSGGLLYQSGSSSSRARSSIVDKWPSISTGAAMALRGAQRDSIPSPALSIDSLGKLELDGDSKFRAELEG